MTRIQAGPRAMAIRPLIPIVCLSLFYLVLFGVFAFRSPGGAWDVSVRPTPSG